VAEALATLLVAAALAAPAETQVASCDPGPVMIGSGKVGWRQESLAAGPLGIGRHPLGDMTPYEGPDGKRSTSFHGFPGSPRSSSNPVLTSPAPSGPVAYASRGASQFG
jgi:hypothetical protein